MNLLLTQVHQRQEFESLPRAFSNQGQSGLSGDLQFTLGNVSLSSADVTLMLLCPLCAALGVLVSFVLKEQEKSPKPTGATRFLKSIFSYIGNLFIGLVLGLVVALFFVGAINDEVTSLARVLALSVLLGYQSRYIWYSQEGVIRKLIDQKVKEVVEDDVFRNSIQQTTKSSDIGNGSFLGDPESPGPSRPD